MKRVLFVFASLALSLSLAISISTSASAATGPHLTATAANASTHAQVEQTDPAKITVYVTKTGGKYHRENCRYLSKSKIPMSLKDAAKKYEPCKVCKPPTVAK